MRYIPTLKPRDWMLLALVLLIAAIVRMGDARLVEFFHDEAMLSLMAQEMADGQTFPLTGIVSSVGLPNPPVSVWVMALPYLFSSNPLTATLYVAALNVAGVGLLWWIARRYFGVTVALVAGIAYALNPWAILYSRKIWAQDFMTPFILLAIALALAGCIENKRWARVLCVPVMLFAAQIHFAGWALLPLVLLIVWMWRARMTRRDLVAALALSALVMLPYMIGLAQTLTHQPDALNTVFTRTGAGEGLQITDEALRYSTFMATGLGVETWTAPNQQDALLANVPTMPLVWGLMGILALLGVIAAWIEHRPLALIVTLWPLLPLLVFSLTWTRAYPHYFIAALPAYALLTGIGLHWLTRILPQRQIARGVLLAGFAGIMFSQQAWWAGMLRYVSTQHITLGEGTSGYTTPLGPLLDVAAALDDAESITIYSEGQDPHFYADAARWPVILRDHPACVRVLPRDARMAFADTQNAFSLWVLPPDETLTAPNIIQRVTPRRGGEQYIVTVAQAALDIPWTPLDTVRFANGVTLEGYALQEGRLYLRWVLPDAPTRQFYAARRDAYQYFVHVQDSSGERIDQYDEAYLQGRWWCAGDVLVTWTPFAEQGTGARVGFYSLTPQNDLPYTPVDVLDTAGQPAGQWVELALEGSAP